MKNLFLMYYELPNVDRAYRVRIDPKFCLMTKDQANEVIEEYNHTHTIPYRYYHVPQLWQRTRPDGSEESISNMIRFTKSYYLQYDKFQVNTVFEENPDELKDFVEKTPKNLFGNVYYTLITFIREHLHGSIGNIVIHQDDIGADSILINFDYKDRSCSLVLNRVDASC